MLSFLAPCLSNKDLIDFSLPTPQGIYVCGYTVWEMELFLQIGETDLP